MNNDRLKFRVWDKNNKRYIYFDFFSHIQSRATEIGKVLDISYSSCGDNLIDATYHLRQTDKVEQCTGLRDINGNLIYDGDVVYDKIYENAFIISWDDDRTGYILSAHNTNHIDYLSKLLINRHQLEIIGNIHEQKG